MKRCFLLVLFVLLQTGADGAASDWISAPKPKFPSAALQKGSEGSVTLQVVLTKDGRVSTTAVLKSSGDPVLDTAAQKAVAKWRMNPAAVKPSDVTKGRRQIVEFKQEAVLAAVYPDRTAYFDSWEKTHIWMYAPFPAYPLRARQMRRTGIVLVRATTGADGRVLSVSVLRSSGYKELDEAAVAAVRLWRAHKQYGGEKYEVPIKFVIGRRGY